MKKITSLLLGMLVLASATFAQPKMKSKKDTKAKTEQTATPKMDPTAPGAAPMKKDGTPDKRFKTAKKADGPMKKDGTKDMRFKKNKMEVKKAA